MSKDNVGSNPTRPAIFCVELSKPVANQLSLLISNSVTDTIFH
ncbi:hypothetical protein bas30_0107 [Escherichia phage TrudiRoth]|uniref:Uncharacterized protein n=2 Tax=Epseptimavirus TaxID=2732017 RepID=A0AAE7W016_9CAUD|nr:hypothetical protein HWC16_gp168 [Salmonella phage Sepoy]QCQ65574.1 hypothetical protein Sepoy_100 [Salmonella phage Sepoy]QXV85337.1 hypothetical protein bas30_0107 [Escherichia phage TrudiRoth]